MCPCSSPKLEFTSLNYKDFSKHKTANIQSCWSRENGLFISIYLIVPVSCLVPCLMCFFLIFTINGQIFQIVWARPIPVSFTGHSPNGPPHQCKLCSYLVEARDKNVGFIGSNGTIILRYSYCEWTSQEAILHQLVSIGKYETTYK